MPRIFGYGDMFWRGCATALRHFAQAVDQSAVKGTAFRLGLAGLVCLSIYAPHLAHFLLPPVANIEDRILKQLSSSPDDKTLDEVSGYIFSIRASIALADLQKHAEEILAGHVTAPGISSTSRQLQGYPQDYAQGEPGYQLFVAGLGLESLLLDAFDQTKDSRFLIQAMSRIGNFSDVDAAAIAPSDFLWNDHAVASRIAVLTRLWRHARNFVGIDSLIKQKIIKLVVRSGNLLAAPGHFTVRTNHGVMQNLALLQIGAAFPWLEQVPAWRSLAIDRLQLQLGYYVSSEGMVLEHSPGYHAHGAELLNMAVRLVVLNGQQPSAELIRSASRTDAVLADLMRTNGTLPLIGNSSSDSYAGLWESPGNGASPLVMRPRSTLEPASRLMPLSGYAIWWTQPAETSPSQTVLAWAKHDGHGHKHADETSITFWSNNTDWISNVGYWPYGAAGYDAANGWSGSNAPHEVSESAASKRTTSLLALGTAKTWRFLETERLNDNGSRFRRQALQIDSDTLLILDFVHSPVRETELLWTFGPNLKMAKLPGASYISNQTPDGRRLAFATQSQPAVDIEILRGSSMPFAGWVVTDRQPKAVDTIRIVTGKGDFALASLFKVGSSDKPTSLLLEQGAQPDKWALKFYDQERSIQLNRVGAKLKGELAGESVLLALTAPPDIRQDAAKLRESYQDAVKRFPPWRDISYYRLRLMAVLFILALVVEAGYRISCRHYRPTPQRLTRNFHMALTAAWLLTAIWAHLFYLR